mmetsp:Transcript_7642/g.13866  ORF Transcript_7642/g.13866 Transcript_7642/m.13866 type:complete len:253 (+) Transcript_7642:789-1547(+)
MVHGLCLLPVPPQDRVLLRESQRPRGGGTPGLRSPGRAAVSQRLRCVHLCSLRKRHDEHHGHCLLREAGREDVGLERVYDRLCARRLHGGGLPDVPRKQRPSQAHGRQERPAVHLLPRGGLLASHHPHHTQLADGRHDGNVHRPAAGAVCGLGCKELRLCADAKDCGAALEGSCRRAQHDLPHAGARRGSAAGGDDDIDKLCGFSILHLLAALLALLGIWCKLEDAFQSHLMAQANVTFVALDEQCFCCKAV